ncbi:hypothetical protein ABPG73_011317 [Tetrahymena malaccensis]
MDREWAFILRQLIQTNRSFAIKISKWMTFPFLDEQPTQFEQIHPFAFDLQCFPCFFNLEQKEISLRFSKDLKELNQEIINQYNQQYSDFRIRYLDMDYYEDYFLPFLVKNYRLLTLEQNISGDSISVKEYNTLKYTFIGPTISYFVLNQFTSKNNFAIRTQILFNDLYF